MRGFGELLLISLIAVSALCGAEEPKSGFAKKPAVNKDYSAFHVGVTGLKVEIVMTFLDEINRGTRYGL